MTTTQIVGEILLKYADCFDVSMVYIFGRNDVTILTTYIDRALSARTADRPEFQRIIQDSEKKLFDVVLVYKLDRFSRDRYDSAHYKRILKKNGIRVLSAKENISEGPEGIILESMLEGYAEYYSAELSKKIHRGQKENALKGKNNGGGVPMGYLLDRETQKLVIDPETTPIVLEVFTRYADGYTIRSIVEDFNKLVLTYNFRGCTQTIGLSDIEDAFGSDLTAYLQTESRRTFCTAADAFGPGIYG